MTKRSWSIDSLVIIFSIIVFAQLMTYVIPQGGFERQAYQGNENRQMVVADTFEFAANEDQVTLQPWYFLTAVPQGFAAAQDVIFLIFIAGGVIAILRKSGAIDAVLHKSVEKLGASPWILIAGCLLIFGIGSYTIGMGEEYVPLIPIIVTMSLAMRMDAIVAMGMVWVPYGITYVIIVFAQLMTYVIPQGGFERQAYQGNENRQMVVADTFEFAMTIVVIASIGGGRSNTAILLALSRAPRM